jgi:hypothetical protein
MALKALEELLTGRGTRRLRAPPRALCSTGVVSNSTLSVELARRASTRSSRRS